MEYKFHYATLDDRDEEIESWRNIFKIDSRYKNRVRGASSRWYKHFFAFINKPQSSNLSFDQKEKIYFDCQDEETTEIIRVPILKALSSSNLAYAESEAKKYSMFG